MKSRGHFLLSVLTTIVLIFQTAEVGARAVRAHPVCMGKHLRKMQPAPVNVARVFLDKEGHYYPDCALPDWQLRQCNASLFDWYRSHPERLDEICAAYGVKVATLKDTDRVLNSLNGSIIDSLVRSINKRAADYDVVAVSIHGFRKKPYNNCDIFTRSSRIDSRRLEASINENTGKKVFYIELYWDCQFVNLIHAMLFNSGYKMFHDYGVPNATVAGIALRNVVSRIEKQDVAIVTHSLGARVGCALLFNTGANVAEEIKSPTPAQTNVSVLMIAPAVGADLFSNYFHRSAGKTLPGDNYHPGIVYNHNDLVLQKHTKFWFIKIGNLTARDLGPTTLGCDYEGDIDKLRTLIKPATLQAFDLSLKGRHARKCHYLNHCYIKNSAKFPDAIKWCFR